MIGPTMSEFRGLHSLGTEAGRVGRNAERRDPAVLLFRVGLGEDRVGAGLGSRDR